MLEQLNQHDSLVLAAVIAVAALGIIAAIVRTNRTARRHTRPLGASMKTLRHISDYLDRLSPAATIIRYLALFGGGLLMGLAHYYKGSGGSWLSDHADTLFWVGFAILLPTGLLLVFIDKQPVGIMDTLNEEEMRNRELEEELIDYKSRVDALAAWNTVNRSLSDLLDLALTNPRIGEKALEFAVEFIAERKMHLFGVEDDYFNISIYEYKEADRQLHCVACFRSRPSDALGEHRAWGVGEGYVGISFKSKKQLVCEDTREQNIAAANVPHDKRRVDDVEKYVSLIATPIAVEEKNPLGVIIVTSDQPNRFDRSERSREQRALLDDIASQLAQLMHIIDRNRNRQTTEGATNGKEKR